MMNVLTWAPKKYHADSRLLVWATTKMVSFQPNERSTSLENINHYFNEFLLAQNLFFFFRIVKNHRLLVGYPETLSKCNQQSSYRF